MATLSVLKFNDPGMGALMGSITDVGIDDDFIKQVREKVTPCTSALFALTSGATAPERVSTSSSSTTSRSSRLTSQRSRRSSCARRWASRPLSVDVCTSDFREGRFREVRAATRALLERSFAICVILVHLEGHEGWCPI